MEENKGGEEFLDVVIDDQESTEARALEPALGLGLPLFGMFEYYY